MSKILTKLPTDLIQQVLANHHSTLHMLNLLSTSFYQRYKYYQNLICLKLNQNNQEKYSFNKLKMYSLHWNSLNTTVTAIQFITCILLWPNNWFLHLDFHHQSCHIALNHSRLNLISWPYNNKKQQYTVNTDGKILLNLFGFSTLTCQVRHQYEQSVVISSQWVLAEKDHLEEDEAGLRCSNETDQSWAFFLL